MMQREVQRRVVGWVGLVLGAALGALAGCAKTGTPQSDGQTHWLMECDSDADCGELSCECGVCTEVCTSDRSCKGDIEAECVTPSALAAASCGAAPPSGLCVPTCERDSDCRAASSALVCEDSLCVPEPSEEPEPPNMPEDGGQVEDPEPEDGGAMPSDGGFVPIDPDAAVDDPLSGERPVISCADEDIDLSQASDVQLIGSRDPNSGRLAIGAGLVYGVEPDSVLRYRVGASEPDVIPVPSEPSQLILEGDELYYGAAPNGDEVVVGRVDLADNYAHLFLAREEQSNLTSLALTPGGILFLADDARGSDGMSTLYRMTREPGSAEPVATHDGQAMSSSLQVIGSVAYYALYVGEGSSATLELYRVPADGSSAPELSGEISLGVTGFFTDGDSLLGALGESYDDLGNEREPQGIVRVDEDDGSIELLYAVDVLGWGGPVISEGVLYFTAELDDRRGIYRARPGQPPELLLEVGTDPAGLTRRLAIGIFDLKVDAQALYFATFCGETEHILRVPKP